MEHDTTTVTVYFKTSLEALTYQVNLGRKRSKFEAGFYSFEGARFGYRVSF